MRPTNVPLLPGQTRHISLSMTVSMPHALHLAADTEGFILGTKQWFTGYPRQCLANVLYCFKQDRKAGTSLGEPNTARFWIQRLLSDALTTRQADKHRRPNAPKGKEQLRESPCGAAFHFPNQHQKDAVHADIPGRLDIFWDIMRPTASADYLYWSTLFTLYSNPATAP